MQAFVLFGVHKTGRGVPGNPTGGATEQLQQENQKEQPGEAHGTMKRETAQEWKQRIMLNK